ncbi:MAG: hypothetical protein JO250_09295 [Armatimonadetes bacterium]|nr:hypothetical protein [Armatimonadota bacterium]
MQAAHQRNSYSTATRATENRGYQPQIRASLEIFRMSEREKWADEEFRAQVAREAQEIAGLVEAGALRVVFQPNLAKVYSDEGLACLLYPRYTRDGSLGAWVIPTGDSRYPAESWERWMNERIAANVAARLAAESSPATITGDVAAPG